MKLYIKNIKKKSKLGIGNQCSQFFVLMAVSSVGVTYL